MSKFIFRAFIPPSAPAPASSVDPITAPAPRPRRNALSPSDFRPYAPPNCSEQVSEAPQIFSEQVPPSGPAIFKPFTPLPTPSSAKRGSYHHDLASGSYGLSWASLEKMQLWIRAEEAQNGIEFRLKEKEPNCGTTKHEWMAKHIYICSRMGTGGKSQYVPKHDRARDIGSKRTNCPCRLVAKTYPGTSIILGRYEGSHSHTIGNNNLIYTRIPQATIKKIESDLCAGLRPDVVVRKPSRVPRQI
ncbi:hypothetical protein C8R43DRAFT_893512 [Mycena crocata]|nr:hypothetical protein C8R43DRAFT_893512 [Mycena crocata]